MKGGESQHFATLGYTAHYVLFRVGSIADAGQNSHPGSLATTIDQIQVSRELTGRRDAVVRSTDSCKQVRLMPRPPMVDQGVGHKLLL